jgi:hypothetical protein
MLTWITALSEQVIIGVLMTLLTPTTLKMTVQLSFYVNMPELKVVVASEMRVSFAHELVVTIPAKRPKSRLKSLALERSVQVESERTLCTPAYSFMMFAEDKHTKAVAVKRERNECMEGSGVTF